MLNSDESSIYVSFRAKSDTAGHYEFSVLGRRIGFVIENVDRWELYKFAITIDGKLDKPYGRSIGNISFEGKGLSDYGTWISKKPIINFTDIQIMTIADLYDAYDCDNAYFQKFGVK